MLRAIWETHKLSRKQCLGDIKESESYKSLAAKYKSFEFVLDNEIELMLEQVGKLDKQPYHLDASTGRIGYKVMDSIEYDVTYGYCTMFAYLKEAERGSLRNPEAVLQQELGMIVSCGQFSYANIASARVLGVSGTVEAMGDYEKDVLADYGINRFLHVPSVYGKSNFSFNFAGNGIYIEPTEDEYHRRITEEISSATKDKCAAIVLFCDAQNLSSFTTSAYYGKLGRNKQSLTEDMPPHEKEFVVKKAATSGQVTVTTAVFGRGTDFFCKDESVQKNGGVHTIQTFLSAQKSEEIQIKGRTARQGKAGSYQLILLEIDLKDKFGVAIGAHKKVAAADRYEWLCQARDKLHQNHCNEMQASLEEATERDKQTHKYFDALLAGDQQTAAALFKENYLSMKSVGFGSKLDIEIAFLVDLTGSMTPYVSCIGALVRSLVDQQGAVMGKLRASFPDMAISFRIAFLGFRDIDDGEHQYEEITWGNSSGHFSGDTDRAVRMVETMSLQTHGGGDIAEDWLGAIDRCTIWSSQGDWKSKLKFMILLTDAPAHGYCTGSSQNQVMDRHSAQHPSGLTADGVVDGLVRRGINLFICSFDPPATKETEDDLSKKFLDHPKNTDQRTLSVVPLVSNQTRQQNQVVQSNRHVIFVLDESGSMSGYWTGVVAAYRKFVEQRLRFQCDTDRVSVVQFSS